MRVGRTPADQCFITEAENNEKLDERDEIAPKAWSKNAQAYACPGRLREMLNGINGGTANVGERRIQDEGHTSW